MYRQFCLSSIARLVVILILIAISGVYSAALPPCGVPTQYNAGFVDFDATILNCSNSMASPLQIRSYWPE